MKPLLESIFITSFGTLPALVLLILCYYKPFVTFRGMSILVVVAVLNACVAILVARYRLMKSKAGDAQTQTEDAEQAETGPGDTTDYPPVYETVVTKPPAYQDLYPTGSCECDTTHLYQAQDSDNSSQDTRCSDPPCYADVTSESAGTITTSSSLDTLKR